MKIAVWDTYVQQADGSVLHFDILVPSTETDFEKIQEYGKAYLSKHNISDVSFSSEMCRFCHVESAPEELTEKIQQQGYDILEMETIPGRLPENPSRRMMILHLRAHKPALRFADFRNFGTEEIKAMANQASNA